MHVVTGLSRSGNQHLHHHRCRRRRHHTTTTTSIATTTTTAHRSVVLFSHRNSIRLRLIALVTHPWFDQLVLSVIILNSFTLAIGDYVDICRVEAGCADMGAVGKFTGLLGTTEVRWQSAPGTDR